MANTKSVLLFSLRQILLGAGLLTGDLAKIVSEVTFLRFVLVQSIDDV